MAHKWAFHDAHDIIMMFWINVLKLVDVDDDDKPMLGFQK